MQITTITARVGGAALVAGLGLLAASCGGSPSTNGVAQLTTTSSSTTTTNSSTQGISKAQDARAFSACMRRNGVPNFPDPNRQGGLTISGGPGSGLNPSSPQFRRAQSACSKYLPNGGKVDPAAQAKALKAALEFSACMRAHGVTSFPDPQTSGGGISLMLKRGSGIDPQSPQFKAAQRACQNVMPGPKGGGGGFSTQGAGAK
jgi:hypothetical protein